MNQKTTTILYWVFTIIFSGLMIFSSLGGIEPNAQTIAFLHKGLGYPIYFIRFISIAKIVGAVAILIPGNYRLKEWAYAGLFFDLLGAIYSGVATAGKFDPMMLTMLIWILPGILSYFFWRKKMKMAKNFSTAKNVY